MPVQFLKPDVVSATGRALAMKIFDEIIVTSDMGFTQTATGRGDPMVLGRVLDRIGKRTLTFLVAWFIDTKEI